MGLDSIDNFVIALASITILDYLIYKAYGKKMRPFLINAMASVVTAAILGVVY